MKSYSGEFPGGLVVRILGFQCRGPGSIPGRGMRYCKPRGQKKKIFCKHRNEAAGISEANI